MRIAIGLDVSSKQTSVSVVAEPQREVDSCTITNDLLGFDKLLKLIHQYSDQDTEQIPEVVFEATGVYSRRLKHFLEIHAVPYMQLNPLQAKHDLSMIKGLHGRKTDRMDALGLSQSQLILNRSKSFVEDPVYMALKDLDRTYQEAVQDLVTNKNRLHRYLQLTFPELEHVTGTTDGIFYWRLVQTFPHPQILLKSRQNFDAFVETLRHLTPYPTSEQRAKSIADKLGKVALTAAPAVSAVPVELEQVQYIAGELIRLSARRKHLIKEMCSLAIPLPELKIFESLPGIGVTSAVTLLAELGDLTRFKKSNQVNAYVGIDLRHYESGDYTASDHISKRGNPYARKILYRVINCMVSSAARSNKPNHIVDYYKKKKQSSSAVGTKKIAIASVSRLIRTLYSLVINNQTYVYRIATKGR
ncbi:IS110 family transposase [Lacticaseibacillus casei]|jgi:transposase|uniref:IS110 family transposase n=1 Tax=Lacticaseibacillus huelsenbergensis TaxID=3035291 RepID=A0ABY8DMM9_9LACO|nr:MULTISPECIES: IS110 family transposase [Lacticaseibacillus]MDG3063119.1 IS110 family transposase [Lacticaseibacillus sp. BCRC 81376]QVI36718.1 IS110 family transposase [Lacticaseibacillus casei]QVI38209.1 IS110 family transposase [Lacticaseibacillus casei]QVI38613.1 IS110 family transposase [Lacticaseibacillus casei]WFB38108.1 IS110 family transposase [Lacticaseibacillus huelsenbergensis]